MLEKHLRILLPTVIRHFNGRSRLDRSKVGSPRIEKFSLEGRDSRGGRYLKESARSEIERFSTGSLSEMIAEKWRLCGAAVTP